MTTNKIKPSLPINQIVKEINWGLLASIAAHGIFFTMVFPRWYSQGNSIDSNSLSNTPIIELNSLEQTRLPNLNPSNSFDWSSLNPLPEMDNFNGLIIPIPPLENNGFDLPPMMDNNVFYNDFAALPPPPPAGITNFSTPPIPQDSFNFEASSPSPIDLPPPPPINQNSLANLPPISQETIDEITEKNNFNGSSPFNTTNTPVNQILDEERQAEIRRQLFANSPVEVTLSPRDIINNRDNRRDKQNDAVSFIAGESPLPTNLQRNVENLTEKLAKNPENTTDEEARKNFIAWATEVQSVTPKEITLAGIYPKDACVKRLEGTTTYGIIVNSMGNVINSQLIKSSGYSLFNEQALKQINARQFDNTTNENIPYHVYINFKYDEKNCPSLSLSNLDNTPPSNQTNPPILSAPKPNSSTSTAPPSPIVNPSSEKNTENKPPSTSTAQPTRVNNLETPSNSADTLKIPNNVQAKPVNPPELPPVIEATPKQESEDKIPSAREIINSPINTTTSASSEKKSEEKTISENDTVIDE